MPLNIDWRQILLHLFNFCILAIALYFLLYKPVKNFMAKRSARYEEEAAESAKLKAEAEELKKQYSDKLTNADAEIEAKRSEALWSEQLRKKSYWARLPTLTTLS